MLIGTRDRTVIKGDSMTLMNQLNQHWAVNNPLIYMPMKVYFDEKIDEYAEKHAGCNATYWILFGDTVVGTTFKEHMWAHFLMYSLPTQNTHSLDEIKELIDSFFEYYELMFKARDELSAKDIMVSELIDAKDTLVQSVLILAVLLFAALFISRFFSMPTQISISIGAFLGTAYGLYREKIFKLFRKNEDK